MAAFGWMSAAADVRVFHLTGFPAWWCGAPTTYFKCRAGTPGYALYSTGRLPCFSVRNPPSCPCTPNGSNAPSVVRSYKNCQRCHYRAISGKRNKENPRTYRRNTGVVRLRRCNAVVFKELLTSSSHFRNRFVTWKFYRQFPVRRNGATVISKF